MINDFRYKTVRKYLETKNDTVILDAFSKLADVALIFTPVALGPAFLPLLSMLTVKDRIFNLGRAIVKFVTKQSEPSYVDRAEQIKIAYGLICFTAYFEALSERLPHEIVKELHDALTEIKKNQSEALTEEDPSLSSGFDRELPFADENLSHIELKKMLNKFYQNTSNQFLKNIQESNYLKKNGKKRETKINKVKSAFESIPKRALEIYEAQYIDLGCTFSDYGFFMQIREFDALQIKSLKNETYIKQILQRIGTFDVGMNKLATLLHNLPSTLRAMESNEIVEQMRVKYRAEIEKPLITDRENEKEIINTVEESKLTFPRVIDAFIPQAYKCLTYDLKAFREKKKIEPSSVWDKIPTEEDIASFFMKYLSSPMSIDYPLIIIGHPGSGKTVLAKIISAQLMCNQYTVIRIPLRDVNTDLDIVNIVETQIKHDSQCALTGGYGSFAKCFSDRPLLIIFDGYDELIQTKGHVFSGYLKRIHTFQQDQKDRKIPVRIIVTSRITLIDKAVIPENSSVLRLLEFDERRRDKWIELWNHANKNYFNANSNISTFSLPREKKGNKSSVIELAEQPLLLLMLAIYDSENNELKNLGENLKRTELYYSLLERFVKREISRRSDFGNLTKEMQERKVLDEMKRLGVAAIGMFNRQKLFIHSYELESDLKAYDVHIPRNQHKDADSLFGSFFFIHKSTAQDISNDINETDNAFEFLHNTFGEFLTADIILKHVIDEITVLNSLGSNPDLQKKYEEELYDAKKLPSNWFLNLMYTPFYSRTVVLEMIREHLHKALDGRITMENFNLHFQRLVEAQIRFFLKPNAIPPLLLTGKGDFGENPVLNYIATYTMNLVTLSSLLLKDGFVFNEEDYGEYDKDGAYINNSELRPWDKLTSLWRAWFSPENLVGITAILNSRREKNTVTIKCLDEFGANNEKGRVELQLSVSNALSDDFMMGLTGLQSLRFCDVIKMDEHSVIRHLKKTNDNFYTSFLIQLIRKEINNIDYRELDFSKVNHLILDLINSIDSSKYHSEALNTTLEIIELALLRRTVYIETQRVIIEFIDYLRRDERDDIHRFDSVTSILFLISSSIANIIPYLRDERILYKKELLHNEHIITREQEYKLILDRYNNLFRTSFKHFHGDSSFKNSYDVFWHNEDQVNFILHNLNKKNLDELLRTNPGFTSQLVLFYIRHYKIRSSEMFEHYFESLFGLQRTLGLESICTDALVNSIKIAKTVKDSKFLEYLINILNETFIKRGREPLAFLILFNPRLLNAILDVNPRLAEKIEISNMLSMDFEYYYDKRRKLYHADVPLLFEHIALYRKLSKLTQVEIEKIIHPRIEHLVKDYMYREMQNVTISQYRDLLWYCDRTGDKVAQSLLRLLSRLLSEGNIGLMERIRNTLM